MLYTIVILAVLFIVVRWNTARNKKKLYDREGRNFRENYFKRKEEKEEKEKKN